MKYDTEIIMKSDKFKDKLLRLSKEYRSCITKGSRKKMIRLNNDITEMIYLMKSYKLFKLKSTKQRFIKLNKRIQRYKEIKIQKGDCIDVKTAFVHIGHRTYKAVRDILERLGIMIIPEWSPTNKDNHMILISKLTNIDWNTIGDDAKLINHSIFDRYVGSKYYMAEIIEKNIFNKKYNFTLYPFILRNKKHVIERLSSYKRLYKDGKIPKTYGKNIWIVKPRDNFGGKGIFLTKNLDKIDSKYYSDHVAQKYLEDPLLIGGNKFDMRFYVLFTQDHRLLLYKSYFVKQTFKKYTVDNITDMSVHLTNWTYLSKMHGVDLQEIFISHKAFIKKYNREYDNSYKDLNLLEKVGESVVKTFDLFNDKIQKSKHQKGNYYSLYGIDIILDSSLNVYLIEINTNPGIPPLAKPDVYKIGADIKKDTYALTVEQVFFKPPKIPKTKYIFLKQY